MTKINLKKQKFNSWIYYHLILGNNKYGNNQYGSNQYGNNQYPNNQYPNSGSNIQIGGQNPFGGGSGSNIYLNNNNPYESSKAGACQMRPCKNGAVSSILP